MMSKYGKNKKVAHEAQLSVSLMFLPHFIIIIIINDIYPGSSTHSKVVFREVLHLFELE